MPASPLVQEPGREPAPEPVPPSPASPRSLVYEAAPGETDRALGDLSRILERRERPVVLVHDGSDAPEPADWGMDQVVPLRRPLSLRTLRLALELAGARHDTARSVRETEDRFFASAVDMLCLLDFSGMFKRLNPAWETTLGFTLEELRSRPFIEFVHPDDRERTLAQNARVRRGERAIAFENRYLCKDGSYRWFRWNATPDTRWPVIYSVARDVTEEKRAQEEREALVQRLQSALAEVRELRTILPICSYCRKVRGDEDYWQTVEAYFAQHTDTLFSHGICPDCLVSEVDPHFAELDRGMDETGSGGEN
jgi:PAS domain S-box-containing protein